MLQKTKIAAISILNLFIIVYLFSAIESSGVKNTQKVEGMIGFTIVVVLSVLSILVNWLKYIPKNLAIIQGFYILRMIMLLIVVYLIYGNKILTTTEIIVGYLLLLLNSLISIKNEKHLLL